MKTKESKAMLEVWEWKETAMKEVEGLELKVALKLRLTKAIETTKELGFLKQCSDLQNINPPLGLNGNIPAEVKK